MILQLLAATSGVAACRIVGLAAPRLIAVVRPTRAVPLLTFAAIGVALAAGIALAAIGAAAVAGSPYLSPGTDWSPAAVAARLPVPVWAGAVAAGVMLLLLGHAIVRTVRILVLMVRADRLCRALRGGTGPVVILDTPVADAYTIAGFRGCVVLTKQLMSLLTADERQMVTLHELSHLRCRHHLYVHLADIAAAANPLLRPVRDAIRFGVERWADEDAAGTIGNRPAAGRALARVALLRNGSPAAVADRELGTGIRLAVGTHPVAARVNALMQPAPTAPVGRFAVPAAACLLGLALGIVSLVDVHNAVEFAERLSGH